MKIRNFAFVLFMALLLPSNAAAQDIPQGAEPDQIQTQDPAQEDEQSEGLVDGAETLGEGLLSAVEEESGFKPNILVRLGIAAAIIIFQALLMRLVWYLFNWLKVKLTGYGTNHFKNLTIRKYHIMDTKQILDVLYSLLKIAKYIVTAFQLFLTIPIVFSLFSPTKDLAAKIFGYILTPLKSIALGILNYIPNIFTIAIIIIITRYALKTLNFFVIRIEKGRLKIPGFYSDWARPTLNVLRILLYAFMVAIIYPYLPGSDSGVFQGVSVFVGIIVSLGSSSAIGNMVAGMVITYMRPFKIGDRIQLNETVGFVVEKSAMVTRIVTHKNEYVTFPNLMVLSSKIVNYHTSTDENEEGLILYADVTMGYAVPWRQVHEILLAAARKTALVEEKPEPYVLQTALDDYYARYQINLYTKAVEKAPAIYSELYQNLQDGFTEAGISLTAPSYQIRLPADSGTAQ
jgi:small-conductance mechanosensitive channel